MPRFDLRQNDGTLDPLASFKVLAVMCDPQIKFLPFHEVWITYWHRFALILGLRDADPAHADHAACAEPNNRAGH